jgi:hypothetical protein
MSEADTETTSSEEEDIPRSAQPGVHTKLRDPHLQIRLLRLDAGSNEDDISATLEVWYLGSEPLYRAISYVCGNPDRMQDITVNGTRISVRHNCYYALWQARLHYPESLVWIDAVCINQLDLEEKTAQVMMMYEIYSRALQVLACIGPSDYNSDAVQHAVDDLDAVVQRLPLAWTRDLWRPPLGETAAALFLESYNRFSVRPYFTRVWVLQELAAGRSRTMLLCGHEISKWLGLMELAKRLWIMYHEDSVRPYRGVCDPRIFLMDLRYSKFPFYLVRISQLQCQDIRDLIYSTSSLIDWASFGETPPIPDYQISPVELALQLVDKLVDTSLRDVLIIARALDLFNPSTILQVLEELQAHRQNAKPHKAPDGRYRQWRTQVKTTQMVQQDTTGRPIEEMGLIYFASSTSSPHRANLLGLSREMLAAYRLAPLYADGVLAAVVSERMRPGDIIVRTPFFDLVLRPHDDGQKFVFVGDAFILSGLARTAPFTDECDCHKRFQSNKYDCDREYVYIAIELSNAEALAAVISRDAAGTGDCSVPEYLDSSILGETRAGSHVWDVTKEMMSREHSIGPADLSCSTHKGGDYYWRCQKFFWYSVLMGTGTVLTFPQKDRSSA